MYLQGSCEGGCRLRLLAGGAWGVGGGSGYAKLPGAEPLTAAGSKGAPSLPSNYSTQAWEKKITSYSRLHRPLLVCRGGHRLLNYSL